MKMFRSSSKRASVKTASQFAKNTDPGVSAKAVRTCSRGPVRLKALQLQQPSHLPN